MYFELYSQISTSQILELPSSIHKEKQPKKVSFVIQQWLGKHQHTKMVIIEIKLVSYMGKSLISSFNKIPYNILRVIPNFTQIILGEVDINYVSREDGSATINTTIILLYMYHVQLC